MLHAMPLSGTQAAPYIQSVYWVTEMNINEESTVYKSRLSNA